MGTVCLRETQPQSPAIRAYVLVPKWGSFLFLATGQSRPSGVAGVGALRSGAEEGSPFQPGSGSTAFSRVQTNGAQVWAGHMLCTQNVHMNCKDLLFPVTLDGVSKNRIHAETAGQQREAGRPRSRWNKSSVSQVPRVRRKGKMSTQDHPGKIKDRSTWMAYVNRGEIEF